VGIKCNKELYCQFLIASQKEFGATNLSSFKSGVSHDNVTRWLTKTKLTPNVLWEHTKGLVDMDSGYLLLDDSVLDKTFSNKISLAKWMYSGTTHRLTKGIDLINMVWTKDNKHIPVDFRIYSKTTDGKTKNDHFRDMVLLSIHRKMRVKAYLFDTWYSSVNNLKWMDKFNLKYVTWLRTNRIVDKGEHISEKQIPEEGLVVHLRAVGFVKVFKFVSPKTGDIEYMATNDINIKTLDIKDVAAKRWKVEEFHRGLKQTVGIERCQARNQRSQRNHIFCSILAFVALEVKRIKTGVTWYQTKREIIKESIGQYLTNPTVSFEFG